MLNTTIYLPKIHKGIKFGEVDTTTEVIFHGNLHDSSWIPYVNKKCGKRYGIFENKNFLAIDHYQMLSEVVFDILHQYPNYTITCTVKRSGKETSGYVCDAELPNTNSEWNLGIVVIELEHAI